MKDCFYITTTLPYVNSDPHIGFAAEIIRADIIARYQRLMGREVFFNTGTDEHGLKIYRKAVEAGKSPQEYVDGYAEKFQALKPLLGLSTDSFIRTTDAHHVAAAQEFWKRCDAAGDIYKKKYSVKYCVGCELEKTDSELLEGKCPIHPSYEIELIEEENYFFRFSKYQKPLLELYEKNPDFVIPSFRFNEIKAFVERGLEDFSISRLAAKQPWGVTVPGDSGHTMYVWFDALVNYISAIGWPSDEAKFNKWWPVVQYAGKDNLRQQSAMWQAMLMSANLKPSKHIVIQGFVTGAGGVKMSKSLGNVVAPEEIVNEYGAEALRYFVARELNQFEDSEFTHEKFKIAYNSGLANGIGNLTSRIMKMASANLSQPVEVAANTIPQDWKDAFDRYDIQAAAHIVWKEIAALDSLIQEKAPFKLVKTDKAGGEKVIAELCTRLYTISRMLNPFLPETSAAIKAMVKENRMPEKPLFLRKD